MPKKQSTEIQTLIFSKPGFTTKSAKSWAKRHNFKFDKTDVKAYSIRIRQHDPSFYKKRSFRTITVLESTRRGTLKPTIKAVIGKRLAKHQNTR